jgi:hypothetical protein
MNATYMKAAFVLAVTMLYVKVNDQFSVLAEGE